MAESTDTPASTSKSTPKGSTGKPKTSTAKKPAASAKPAPRRTAASSNGGRTSSTGSSGSASSNRAQARSRFGAAIEEARAGVAALRADALDKTAAYRKTATDNAGDWVEDARTMGAQARKRASELAQDGKTRASDGLASLGKTVSDTAATIDERLGKQYGDYARTAARSIQEAAAKLDAKDLGELGDDARDFIRKSPGAAIGIAAVAGFFLARMFRGGSDD